MKKSIGLAWMHALKPTGKVLEIGFSPHSLLLKAQSCVILEVDPEKIKQAKKLSNVTLIQEYWQTALPKLGSFDLILFNHLVITNTVDEQRARKANLILQEGQETLKMAENLLPNLSKIQYKDKDLENLCRQVGSSDLKYISRFLCELRRNGQISQKQHEHIVEKYHLNKEAFQNKSPDISKQTDDLFDCLSQCIKNHMRSGSRFSCLLDPAGSKYEDPKFFENFIVNPAIDYQEKPIVIDGKEVAIYMLVEMF